MYKINVGKECAKKLSLKKNKKNIREKSDEEQQVHLNLETEVLKFQTKSETTRGEKMNIIILVCRNFILPENFNWLFSIYFERYDS